MRLPIGQFYQVSADCICPYRAQLDRIEALGKDIQVLTVGFEAILAKQLGGLNEALKERNCCPWRPLIVPPGSPAPPGSDLA